MSHIATVADSYTAVQRAAHTLPTYAERTRHVSRFAAPRSACTVWAERLADAVEAHLHAPDWGTTPTGLAQEQSRLQDLTATVRIRPPLAGTNPRLRAALLHWRRQIDAQIAQNAAAQGCIIGAQGGVFSQIKNCPR